MATRYGLSLKLDCENSAFDGNNRPAEIARILRRLADQIETIPLPYGTRYDARLFDSNGNSCGSWDIKPRRIRD